MHFSRPSEQIAHRPARPPPYNTTVRYRTAPRATAQHSTASCRWAVLAVDSSSLSEARLLGIERPLARRFGYVPARAHVFASTVPLAVVEWAPAG